MISSALLAGAAYASAPVAAPQGSLLDFIPFILIIVIFWFLVIRPQSKRMKEHKAMVAALRRNDTVITGGGLIGKVTKLKDDDEVEVELAEGVRVRVLRQTISQVQAKGEPAKADK